MKNRNAIWTFLILLLGAPFTAQAVIMASLSGCDAISCMISPDGGPVAVDPLGFTLEVDWSPEHIELIEPAGDRGEWLLTLAFNVDNPTDANSGDFGDLVLREMGGVEIAPLNEQIDDVNAIGLPTVVVTFEIFGPDAGASFYAHGFTLGLSNFPGTAGAGAPSVVTWDSATLSTRQGSIDQGVWVMPAPFSLSLIPLGFVAMWSTRRK